MKWDDRMVCGVHYTVLWCIVRIIPSAQAEVNDPWLPYWQIDDIMKHGIWIISRPVDLFKYRQKINSSLFVPTDLMIFLVMIKLQAHSCFRLDHFIITALINVSECPASFLSRNSLPLSPLLRSLGSERGFSMTPSPGPGCCYAGAAARNAAAVVLLLVVVLLSLKFTCSFLNTRDKYSHEIVVIIQIYITIDVTF